MNTNLKPMDDVQPQPAKRGVAWFKLDVRAYTMIGALLVIWILFAMLNDSFITSRNISNLFLQMSVTSVLAIGMVLVIVAGHIDLSIGSIVGLTGGVSAILNVWYDWHTVPVIIAVVILGAIIGLFQGWIVAYKAVPAFIVTLGGMLVYRGILLGISGSQTISGLSPSLKAIGTAYVVPAVGMTLGIIALAFAVVGILRKRASRVKYGFDVEPYSVSAVKALFYALFILGFVFLMNRYQGIPVPFVFVIVLAVIFTFIAKHTVFGRHVYAIGGNADAARLSGIHMKKRILLVFILCNTLAAVSGLILTARLNAATMNAGNTYELDAIAACVIGGTSLMGGTGTIAGAIIGSLVMASLDNGMSIMNLDTYWQFIVKGCILVFAVWVDYYSRQKKKLA